MASKNSIQVFIDAQARLQGVEKTAKDFQKIFDNMVIDQSLRTKIDDAFKLAFKDLGKYGSLLEKAITGTASGKELRDLAKEGKNVESSLKAIQKIYNSFDDAALVKAFDTKNVNKQMAETQKQLQQLQQRVISFGTKGKGSNAINKLIEEIGLQDGPYNQILKSKKKGEPPTTIKWLEDIQKQFNNVKTIEDYQKALEKLESVKARLENTSNKTTDTVKKDQYTVLLQEVNKIIEAYKTLGQTSRNPFESISKLQEKLKTLSADSVKILVQAAREAGISFDGATSEVSQFNDRVSQTGSEMAKMRSETEQLLSQFTRFTTLAGIFEIFRRSIRSAFESVKELDAAMNSIAVVTDKKTDELWNAIEKYTDMANRTGSTIAGTYQVSQLYYQQGLGDSEVEVMTEETLKMARIAGIEYAEATDYMTAAIKGFGLAYEEVTHISDVYSNLAAKTATDTEEIAIAMSKVASIAHSTGMEMETTAAMLAQILEVTREAPETAGTALKTVIARFGEVKTLIEKGEATGTDEEGEAIDVNRIDAALKTAGMSLLDEAGQMRDLDDVLLELSSRWSGLSDMQQRYIATQAAGSRQQSRFLALMNDYQGLMKMVGYATDSAGASQAQFDKTLESLESKLNNLNNAWTSFTTGITNQTVIKGTVDILTKLLTVVNEGTSLFGDFGTTIIRAVGLFGALRLAGKATGSALVKSGFAKESDNLIQGLGTLGKIDGSFIKKISNSFEKIGKKDSFSFGDVFSSFFDVDSVKQNFGDLKNIFQGIFEIDPKSTTEIKETLNRIKEFGEDTENFSWIEDFLNNREGPVEFFNDNGLSQLQVLTEQLGISQDTLNTIRQSSLSIDQQALLLSNQRIAAQAAEIIGNTDLTESERAAALARLQESAATGVSTAATIKNTAAKLANTKVIGKVIQAITGLKPAANTGKVAITSMGQAIGVFAATAGIALAVIGTITAAIIYFYRQTNAFETKKAQAALKGLQEAASQSKKRLEDLESALESFEEKQNAFDGLIENTEAWNKALFEANQQVLELISTYPELAKYMSTGEFGQLTISQEGWDKVIGDQRESASRASAGAALAQGQVEKLRYNKQLEDVANKAKYLMTDEDGNFIEGSLQAFKERDREGLQDLLTPSQFNSVLPLMAEYSNLLYQQAEAVQTYNTAAATSMIDAEHAAYEYADSIAKNFGRQDFGDGTHKAGDFLMGKHTRLQDALSDRGIADRGSRKNNLKALYANLAGIDYEDVTLNNNDDLKYAISEMLRSEDLNEAVDDFTQRMANLDKEMAVAVNGVMTEGEGWTQEEIGKYSDQDSATEYLTKQSKALGYESLDAYADALGYENGAAMALKMVEYAEGYKDEIESNLNKFGSGSTFDLDGMTVGLSKEINRALTEAAINGADISGKDGLNNIFKSIFDSSEYDLEIANLISKTDFSDVDSIEKFIENLEKLGLISENSAGSLEEWKNQLVAAANATKDFNLDGLINAVKTTKKLLKDLEDREDTERGFSEEIYKELISAGTDPSQFAFDGEEFIYLGDSLDNLNEILQQILQDDITEQLNSLDEAIKKGQEQEEKGNKLLNSTTPYYYTDAEGKKQEYSPGEIYSSLLAGASLEGYSNEMLRAFANAMEFNIPAMEQLTKEELIAAIVNAFVGGNTLQGNIATYGSVSSALYNPSVAGGGQAVLNMDVSQENAQARTAGLQAAMMTTEGGSYYYERQAQYLEATNKQLSQYNDLLYANAYDTAKAAKEVDDINEVFEENEDILKGVDKESVAYNKAVSQLGNEIEEAFNVDNIDEWIKANMDLVEGMNDSEEGYDAFIRGLLDGTDQGRELLDSLRLSSQEVIDLANQLDGTTATIDLEANGEVNTDAITKWLLELYEQTGTVDEYVSMLARSGLQANIQYVEDGNGQKVISAVTYSRISGGGTKGYSGGGGGGGGGGGKNDALPKQDRFYNYIKNLEGYERAMENLQDEMEILFDSDSMMENLDAQTEKFSELLGATQSYLNALESDAEKTRDIMTSKFGKYITFAEDGSIRLTEAYYNATGEIVEEMDQWIDEYDDVNGRIDEQKSKLLELKKEAIDFFDEMRDSAIDLVDELAEILKERDEKALEEKEKYYEELEKKDDEYLEAVRENIEAERKARDRANTFEDLSKKQSKLALLQRDTSGLYANEISSLQEEIDQTQQELADEQIDNILDAIEKENEDAAKRHEEILQAMQDQIDTNVETRYYIEQAEEAIKAGDKAVMDILKSGQDWMESSDAERKKMEEEWTKTFSYAYEYFTSGYKDSADYLAKIMHDDLYTQTSRVVEAIGDIKFPSSSSSSSSSSGPDEGDDEGNNKRTAYQYSIYAYNQDTKRTETIHSQKSFASQTLAEQGAANKMRAFQGQGKYSHYTKWHYKVTSYQYKHGGIVDYTGPAWVDGTKSRPEAFLNPEQTEIIKQLAQNLIKVKAVTPSGLSAASNTTNNSNCEINIEIGSIGNNVNIDEAIAKIKNEIIQSTQYRNVSIATRRR